MQIIHHMWCACAGVLLGLTLMVCDTASVVALAQPDAGAPALVKKNADQRDVRPLPEAGETAHYRYQRDSGNMYWIMPADSSPPYLVSESFLQTTLNSRRLDSAQQADMLRTYPALMQGMFTQTMTQAYPDGTVESEAPFSSQSFEATDGTQVLLEQDPVAAPYVRVRLSGPEGEPEEFSVARTVVERMLARPQFTDDHLLQGVRSFPFRLPESARAGNFARLSAEDLALLVQREPALRQYEFVQMAQYRERDADQAVATPRVPRERQARQLPPAPAPSAAPPGGQHTPPRALLPSQTLAMGETREAPHPNTAIRTYSIGGRSQPGGKASEHSSAEAPGASGIWTNILHRGLHIAFISLLALSIIALVVSRVFFPTHNRPPTPKTP